MYIWSRRIGVMISRMRRRAETMSPRHASSQARVRSRVAHEVATGLSPTSSARRRAAAAASHSPSRRWPWATPTWAHTSAASCPTDRRLLGHRLEALDRLAGPPGVAGDLGERHLEPHPGARWRSSPAPARRPSRAAAVRVGVVAGVGEGVGLVDDVHGDARAGPAIPGGWRDRRRPGGRSTPPRRPDRC